MKVRLRLNELKKWITNNTNEKNDGLKELFFNDKKVIKIKHNIIRNDMFIFQTEDGYLNYEEYDYCLGDEITDTDFFIITQKRWRATKDKKYYCIFFIETKGVFEAIEVTDNFINFDNKVYLSGNYFRTPKEAKKFVNDLNEAIAPLFEKAKNGEYDEKD